MAYENSANSGLFDGRIFTTFFSCCLLFLSFLIVSCFLFLMSCVLSSVCCFFDSCFLCHVQISKCIEMHRTLEQQSSGRRSRIVHF